MLAVERRGTCIELIFRGGIWIGLEILVLAVRSKASGRIGGGELGIRVGDSRISAGLSFLSSSEFDGSGGNETRTSPDISGSSSSISLQCLFTCDLSAKEERPCLKNSTSELRFSA